VPRKGCAIMRRLCGAKPVSRAGAGRPTTEAAPVPGREPDRGVGPYAQSDPRP